MAISAGVTFFALLAIFPAIAAMVSTYGLFADLKKINADLSSLATILPGGAIDIVGEQIKRIAAQGSKTLGVAHLSGFAETAKQQAASAVAPIKDNARSLAEEQKQRGASQIDNVAQAIHNAAEEISREIPQAADYVHAAADRLQGVSRMLRENSVEELLQKGVDLAEERPLLFTGGAVALGFLLTRFLRSSAPAYDESEEE